MLFNKNTLCYNKIKMGVDEMTCATCSHANKSGNDDWVFCTYWQNKCNESKMETIEFVKNVVFEQTDIIQLATGWGFPLKHFAAESHWSHKGTASEGVMWNNQILIQKDEKCQNHS
ncbi:hypothetical protein D3C78_19960 [compost metagenome]